MIRRSLYILGYIYIYIGDKNMKHFFIELEDEMHKEFKSKCYSEGRTLSETVKILIKKYLNGEIKI